MLKQQVASKSYDAAKSTLVGIKIGMTTFTSLPPAPPSTPAAAQERQIAGGEPNASPRTPAAPRRLRVLRWQPNTRPSRAPARSPARSPACPLTLPLAHLAGETFEQAVLLSVGMEDTQSFQRHFAQLKPFYAEAPTASPLQCTVCGLNLMLLLVENRLAEFHSEVRGTLPRVRCVGRLLHHHRL